MGGRRVERKGLCLQLPRWCGRDSLPAGREMEPVDLGRHIRQEQLQLGEEREVVGGDVGVWATADIVLYEPVGVQGAQDTQHVQVRLGVENVVNDTLGGRGRKASCLQEGSKRSSLIIRNSFPCT